MKKTYKLTYESIDVSRAVFDNDTVTSKWVVGAPLLKAFSEYFGARTEHLDTCYDAGKMVFTSYTEKVMKGNGRSLICSFPELTPIGKQILISQAF